MKWAPARALPKLLLFTTIIVASNLSLAVEVVTAQSPLALYEQLRAFQLSDKHLHAEHLAMNRDRIKLEWTGDFYPEVSVTGKTYGAVFLGHGHITVEPTSTYEKASVRRFLKGNQVEEDFTTAVLRFTDDTYDLIASLPQGGGSSASNAQKLAFDL